jgi:multidrug transporter EmrE-like cation transporter
VASLKLFRDRLRPTELAGMALIALGIAGVTFGR